MKTFSIDIALEKLKEELQSYKVPVIDLIAIQTRDPFKVLIATILSARTKDEITAKAAAKLFKKADTADALAALSQEEIAQYIYPVGFYKQKARYLTKIPKALQQFKNNVPNDLDSLLQLPGVGRKTANLVLVIAFDKPAICVDTHVHRIMNIWGYVKTKTPYETEMALRKKLPARHWLRVNSLLVAFGQAICKPIGPHCDQCVLASICQQKGVTPRKVKSFAKRM